MGVTYAAWTALTASQWASGQPVNQTLVQGIINNINDLNTRLTAIESKTTGGTVTGPLRWSGLQWSTTYANAWTTCLAMTPAWTWRVPSENEMEIGRHMNAGLFSGNKYYWSSSEFGQWSWNDILVFNPSTWVWAYGSDNTSTFDGWSIPMELRCVSDAN